MTKSNCKTINGYIEGYYGRLLTWNNRERILNRLQKNKMYNYLYAPKEDVYHRRNWREPYTAKWSNNFRLFCKSAKSKQINIIFGISPGIDFNFNYLDFVNKNDDFNILLEKCLHALKLGATTIALQLDDIPDHFLEKYSIQIHEGTAHALLANELSKYLGSNIFVIPRVYSDELIESSKEYLFKFGSDLSNDLMVFYCGINVVEKKINKNSKKVISKFLNNKIIFWDNFYANDYCPRRLFIGPWTNRNNKMDIMINLTGMIETDLLIIDIVGNNLRNTNFIFWKEALLKNNVPSDFFKIKKYFLSPDFSNSHKQKNFKYIKKDIKILDNLLWKWNSDISREWYPILMGLKVDLQYNLGLLDEERLIKTQTKPLIDKIL